VDAGKVLGPIPDQVYGSNQPLDAPVKLRRHGGNRWTGYNWENNASNAGHDWHHTSDFWLNTLAGLPNRPGLEPAALVLRHLLLDKEAGAESIITVPMAGYVAADGNGKVGEEPAPNRRWVKVIPRKGKPFADPPDLEDGRAYVDEFVDHLHRRWGRSDNGVKYFSLDNEPALWNGTHPRIHPKPASYRSLRERSVATAAAILDLDPGAQIIGPALYGWQAARKLQDAPDSAEHNKAYEWFVGYYLDQMRQAGEAQGRRLLHWFDMHWYPEARGGGLRITEAGNNVSPELVEARVQAPRSLWDPDYVESSWIAENLGKQPIVLIPRLQASIERWYPGTKLAFAEFSYGGGGHISGALAVADALGVFGRHGAMAAHWSTSSSEAFTAAAYRLYLDYDGKGGRFGDLALDARADDKAALSVHAAAYASAPGRLSVLVIHKGQEGAAPMSLALAGADAASVQSWRLQGGSPAIKAASGARLNGLTLHDELPPLSATLYILSPE
jgi:mannan endo-1,4-beta-mannosidase